MAKDVLASPSSLSWQFHLKFPICICPFKSPVMQLGFSDTWAALPQPPPRCRPQHTVCARVEGKCILLWPHAGLLRAAHVHKPTPGGSVLLCHTSLLPSQAH